MNTENKFYLYENDLKDQNVLVLGASGYLGTEICKELKKRNANLFTHTNNGNIPTGSTTNFKCDLSNNNEVNEFINYLVNSDVFFNSLIIASANIEEDIALIVDFYSIVNIINLLIKNKKIKDCILKIGLSIEDFNFEGNSEFLSANRAIHGYLASASGEFSSYEIKTIYLKLGFLEKGISKKLNQKEVIRFMNKTGQEELLSVYDIANDIVNSLSFPKVLNVKYTYENTMLVGQIGYKTEVDV